MFNAMAAAALRDSTRTALALVITALVATGGFAVMRAQADTPPAAAARPGWWTCWTTTPPPMAAPTA